MVQEEDEVDGREEKEKEEEKEETVGGEGEGGGKDRKEEEGRSHKYVRNANKNPQRTALVVDTILRHADTSILISPRGLSEEETAFFCCIHL